MNSDLLWGLCIAITTGLDNLSIGIVYGLQRITISHKANFIIAAVSFLGSWGTAVLGAQLTNWLPAVSVVRCGAVALCLIGAWMLMQVAITAHKKKQPLINVQLYKTKIYIGPAEILQQPERADLDGSRDLGSWEAAVLGIALSINALAGGFDAGAIQLAPLLTAACIATASLITIAVGFQIGRRYSSEAASRATTCLASIAMLLLGLYQFISAQ